MGIGIDAGSTGSVFSEVDSEGRFSVGVGSEGRFSVGVGSPDGAATSTMSSAGSRPMAAASSKVDATAGAAGVGVTDGAAGADGTSGTVGAVEAFLSPQPVARATTKAATKAAERIFFMILPPCERTMSRC